MGIRFACHVCERRLNIKRELAGRRGICPVCAARIRIPLADTDKSKPVDEEKPLDAAIVAMTGPASPGNPATFRESAASGSHPTATPSASSLAPSGVPSPQIDSGALDLLTEDGEASWYVRPPSGGQYGPATTEVLKQWIGEGRVATTALLWREGWPQWREASDALPEFADRLPEHRSTTAASRPESFSEPNSLGSNTVAASSLDAAPRASSGASRRTSTSSTTKLSAARSPNRQSRSLRRVMTIGALAVVALSLILVLVLVVSLR